MMRILISEVERGIRNVSIDNMGLLVEAIGVPLKQFVDPEMFASLDDELN
ncbi:helix-turn-helix domain-containing protein [Pseudoduganella aquatica]|nr:helix-turn-helix domain-containing protein [Pseudoduganella aquatica]